MDSYFRLSIQFLNPTFHGRRDWDEPEWPPSPLRVFEAIVAAAGSLWPGQPFPASVQDSFRWLEQLPCPIVKAPLMQASTGYRLSVPNNDMDVPAKAWAKNQEPGENQQPAKLRTMKTVKPALLQEGDAVHYFWPISAEESTASDQHLATLSQVSHSIVALGWGVDMVTADSKFESDCRLDGFPGERWNPVTPGEPEGLRCPAPGTFDELTDIHTQFIGRLRSGTFRQPRMLTAFRRMSYLRPDDVSEREVAAFNLLTPDAGHYQIFDPARRGLTLVGMTRNAAKRAAQSAGWSDERINSFILGHSQEPGMKHVGPSRVAFLPLPSIESRGEGRGRVVGQIRRVLVTSFAQDSDREISWFPRALSGLALVSEHDHREVALLSSIPRTEKMVRHYTRPASTWSTVTPVVLPGYDDPRHYRRRIKQGVDSETQKLMLAKLDDRIDGLLRKAMVQAGLSEIIAANALLEWRNVGFMAGVDLSERYGTPDHLKRYPKLHVKIDWRDQHGNPLKLPGPICLGGGRFYGLGLFAAMDG